MLILAVILISLLAGDGIRLRPSGLIGSVLGAVNVLAIWRAVRSENLTDAVGRSRSGDPRRR